MPPSVSLQPIPDGSLAIRFHPNGGDYESRSPYTFGCVLTPSGEIMFGLGEFTREARRAIYRKLVEVGLTSAFWERFKESGANGGAEGRLVRVNRRSRMANDDRLRVVVTVSAVGINGADFDFENTTKYNMSRGTFQALEKMYMQQCAQMLDVDLSGTAAGNSDATAATAAKA